MIGNNHPERFERIIKAIGESKIKKTIKTIHIADCGMGLDQLNLMLETHGLGHVELKN